MTSNGTSASYFVARKIWRRHAVPPLCGMAHRLQRREPLQCFLVLIGSTFRRSTNGYKLSEGGLGFLRRVAPGSHLALLVKQVRQRRRFEPDLRVATDPF